MQNFNYPGIYIVRLSNVEPMPVTRDPKYVNICAKVNNTNIKIGKATNLARRKLDYWKEFDQENVIFEPLVNVNNIKEAEKEILRSLKQFRKTSPKGGKLEWLEGISYELAKRIVFETLDRTGIKYTLVEKNT
jgi:hypothetical protein